MNQQAKHTPGQFVSAPAFLAARLRPYITKSRAGHYTVSVRNALGALVYIQDKLPTLEAAREAGRAAIAKARSAS